MLKSRLSSNALSHIARSRPVDDVSEALAIALPTNHGLSHQQTVQTTTNPASAPRGPKLEQPKINIGVTVEEWNIVTRRWDVFRSGSENDEASATIVPVH